MALKRKLILCRNAVKRGAIRREVRNGVEHIVIAAATLPDNVVMNGGLYPADEIAKSFQGLERKLAPVEHPSNPEGEFLSASDPVAINQFYAGAWNENVRRVEGRVHHDVVVNVPEAQKSERGRRLLDRVVELETNKEARPIHTSVGLWLDVEPVPEPKTNAQGQEYNWVARNMDFDHNAILLDQVGAATPGQGVGMAVNQEGGRVGVDQATLDPGEAPPRPSGNEDVSMSQLMQALYEAFERSALEDPGHIEEVYPDIVIYWVDDVYYRVPYRLDSNGIATIAGMPEPVERRVTYEPKTNSNGDDMKELILNKLKDTGIPTDGLDDAALLAAYQTLTVNEPGGQADNNGSDDNTDQSDVVAVALNALTEKMAAVEAQLNEQSTAEKERLAGLVLNSKQYPGLDEAALKALPLDTLKSMASHLGDSVGLPPTFGTNSGDGEDIFAAPTAMPQ